MTDPTSLPNFTPSTPGGNPAANASATPVRDRIFAVLQANNLNPTVDGDGDLEYKLVDDQGIETTLFARVAEGEIAVVRFFGQWTLQPPVSDSLLERLARCNDMTLQLNIVKLSLVEESLVVSSEHVITEGSNIDLLVPLSINHILQSVSFFFQSWMSEDQLQQNGQPVTGLDDQPLDGPSATSPGDAGDEDK